MKCALEIDIDLLFLFQPETGFFTLEVYSGLLFRRFCNRQTLFKILGEYFEDDTKGVKLFLKNIY